MSTPIASTESLPAENVPDQPAVARTPRERAVLAACTALLLAALLAGALTTLGQYADGRDRLWPDGLWPAGLILAYLIGREPAARAHVVRALRRPRARLTARARRSS